MRTLSFLMLAACNWSVGTEWTVGSDSGARVMRTYFEDNVGQVDSLSCPSTVPAKTGGTYVCEVRFVGGEEFKIDVTQTSDEGRIRFAIADKLVAPGQLVVAITTWLEKSGKSAKVDCGARVRRFASDGTHRCTAVLADGSRTTIIARMDGDSYTWSLASDVVGSPEGTR